MRRDARLAETEAENERLCSKRVELAQGRKPASVHLVMELSARSTAALNFPKVKSEFIEAACGLILKRVARRQAIAGLFPASCKLVDVFRLRI